MHSDQMKEQFSIAYAHAVATVAGLNTGEWRVDDESVDFMIGQRGGCGTIRNPRLEVQMKCTALDVLKADGVHFKLLRKNYDDLRDQKLHVPKILVVMLVPEKPEKWMSEVSEDRLCLHRCAWWMSLRGCEEHVQAKDPTIVLPRGQLFNVVGLQSIMKRIGEGQNP